MSTQTVERREAAPAGRLSGKYVSLASFKRDGTPIATPMWFVDDGVRLLVITDAHSAKVKRIRRNPQVTVAACGPTGRLTGEPLAAEAEILPSSEHERAQELLRRKYRLDFILILPVYNLIQRIRGGRQSGEIAVLAITPRALA